MDSYLKEIVKVLAFGAGVATLPLIAAFATLQPPWPPAIEYVSAVFIVMAALAMWEWGRGASRVVRRRLVIAGMVLTVGGIGAYLPLYSQYVVTVPASHERLVRGTDCTPAARAVYRDCPDPSDREVAEAEWDAERLWTRASILRVRLELVAAWLCFTAGLVAFVGAVVAGRRVPRAAA